MPLSKKGAYAIMRNRGYKDKFGRRIRNPRAYASGMVKKTYRGGRRFGRYRRGYRRGYRRY